MKQVNDKAEREAASQVSEEAATFRLQQMADIVKRECSEHRSCVGSKDKVRWKVQAVQMTADHKASDRVSTLKCSVVAVKNASMAPDRCSAVDQVRRDVEVEPPTWSVDIDVTNPVKKFMQTSVQTV